MSNMMEKNCNVHLHAEVELLKKALVDKQAELSAMRSACYQESERQGELEDVVLAWQDKFERLYESHKKVQKINQNLEDKLLKLVDRNSNERAQMTSDCATLNIRLTQANYNISSLQREIERYKQDINLAIQLLQCKPDSFLPQKITSLPLEMQSKVASYMKLDCQSDSESSVIGNASKAKYQILPTNDEDLPLVPSRYTSIHGLDHNKNGELSVSPVVIAKFLESELKAKNPKHCHSCSCSSQNLIDLDGMQTSFNIAIQTDLSTLSCIRCNSNLNSPSHTSPYLIKLKSSDSVISETKSSVSDFTNQIDKTPSKKDDLMVNPILGHHRLCEHTKNFSYQPMIPKESECGKDKDMLKSPKVESKGSSLKEIPRLEMKAAEEKEQATMSHGPGNGSNNSLWSKASSKEGAKLFENFNRNLIKTMKAENPRIVAPRICSLKIQNGSSNILLDNSHGEMRLLTRRARLLDEELLDEDKDISGNLPINFTSSPSSMVLSTPSNLSNNQNDEIFSTNKTDSEKFNEIQCKDVSVSKILSPEKKPAIVKECEVKAENLISIESMIDVHDSLLLRRQQLTRVAEWVQNSSNIPLPITPEQKSSDASKQINSSLDIENNNSVAGKQNYASLNNQMLKESTPSCEHNAQNRLSEKLKVDVSNSSASSNKSDELADDKNELAQMEYNVKKFLLKQNEWSISSRPLVVDPFVSDEENIFIRNSYQRTETNL